jgi:glycosyltransferase involved in cell wall biosynthesis
MPITPYNGEVNKKITYIGNFSNISGYSEACRNNVASLLSTGENIEVVPLSFEEFKTTHGDLEKKINSLSVKQSTANIQIIHTTPPVFKQYFNPKKKNIFYTTWETNRLPSDWVTEINKGSQVWVPSCFPKGTLVLTKNGYKNIEDIQIGEKVFTHIGNNKKVNRTYHRTYNDLVYKFRTIDSFECSKEHPLLIADIEFKINKERVKILDKVKLSWEKAENCEVGNYLCFPKMNFEQNINFTLDLEEIFNKLDFQTKSYDFKIYRIYQNRTTLEKRNLKIPSEIELNEDLCRLLGYYIADGSQNSRKKISGINIVFGKNEDLYIKDVINLGKKIFGIEPKVINRNNTKIVLFSNTGIAKLFQYLVLGIKKNKQINPEIFQKIISSKNSIVENLLIGYFNGDGYIQKEEKSISGFTISESWKNQLVYLNSKLELFPTISSYTQKPTKKIKQESPGFTWKYSGKQLEVLHRYLSPFNQIEYSGKKKRHNDFYENKDYFFFPIKERDIEKKEIEIYNLEVSEDNSYIVNRSSVHNCSNVEVFKNSGVKIPVKCIPHSFPEIDASTIPSLEIAGKNKETFIFYSMFQWTSRKNPVALLKAYLTEFKSFENVLLVIKTYITKPDSLTEKDIIKQNIQTIKDKLGLKEYPKIVLITSLLSKDQIHSLHKAGDVYLSFHCDEGYGIPPAEAMMFSHPVISTNYGGPTDFINISNGFPVNYQLTPVYDMPWSTYVGSDYWADINIKEAKEQMRYCFNNRENVKLLGQQAKEWIAHNNNYLTIGNLMKEAIKELT